MDFSSLLLINLSETASRRNMRLDVLTSVMMTAGELDLTESK